MAFVPGDCGQPLCPLHPRRAVPIDELARLQLADAFAEQSRSDFDVYRLHLTQAEECHRLHYLQMACEKVAKAYRLRDTESFGEDDLYSHNAFSKFVQNFLKSPQIKRRYQSQDNKRRQLERYARNLAEEIEKLNPAVDRGRTPSNVEYPWINGGQVFVPCRHRYTTLTLLSAPGGREFLKLIEIAIEDYESITLTG